jgi:hypothetical protein
MNDIIDFYKEIRKADLISAYKHYLLTNNRKRKKSDGFGKMVGNGLERPKISGEVYSWAEFNRLPKDVIILHTFVSGVDKKYITKLTDRGFFKTERKVDVLPWKDANLPYLQWLWINNESYATTMYPEEFGFPPEGVRGQNYWAWLDKFNPKQVFGFNWDGRYNG